MESKYLLLMFFVFILSMSIVSANENIDVNVTSIQTEPLNEIASDLNVSSLNNEVSINEKNLDEPDVLEVSSQDSLKSNDEVIVVNNWDELQYYCSLSDKDYTLRLKENTNFYPTQPKNYNYQITINNNVKIIGSDGAYIGDTCQRNAYIKDGHYVVEDGDPIVYAPIIVPDNNRKSLNLENITFKWIYTLHNPDGVFLQMGGNAKYEIKNCVFESINTMQGHSCIVYLKKGDAILENCSFINCTTDFGCVSLYDPNSYTSARMTVKDCYFENNFARTEPGCINNCAVLTIYNTTFYKNRAGMWAGAIHTHFYASATIYDSNFTDNLAGWNGGALYTYSDLKIYNTVFSGNNCTTNNGGGAIGACKHVSPPHIYIENSLFENNANNCWSLDDLSTDGTGRGGAISLMDEGSLEVRNTTFISNAASIGTAICAIEAGSYGSPDVIIVNNTFISHTREGDVIYVRVKDTICNISDNYYLGNSIEFSNLTLSKLDEGKEYSTLQITADLKNPSYYDSNILNKTFYDVYVNGKYVKTVNSTTFKLDFGDLDICNVYVIPTISNRKSNEVTLTSTREYIFVSKNGSDNSSGISRDDPVKTIKKALDLARNCQNIIILDGDYSENLEINYNVTLKGEGNATLTDKMSFSTNADFTLKNLKINNLNTDTFIKQNNNNLCISNCIIINNNALLVYNNGFTTIVNSILLNNSNVLQGNGNYVLEYNWWGNSAPDLNINKYATLNITSDADSLENNQKTNVRAVFYLNDGSKYTQLPEINLNIAVVNGVVNKNITAIDSNIIYTLTAFSDGILTINYNDFKLNKTFDFLKSNPSISITADDIMFGDNLTIIVNLPNDVEGNLTVNVGSISQNNVNQSPKTVFTFPNLKAGTYEIFANYSGDKKYQSKTTTTRVNVGKYQSTTNLNISTINVGNDVILTITTTNSSIGTITLSINNKTQTLTLNNSKANYTIKNIKRGDYLITAVYNGDDKYLTSHDSKFIEVDNLNATMTIQAEDITYGETAIIKASLNDDATGEVVVTIDGITNSSKVINGKANIAFFNLDAGSNKNISVFYSGDDTYFNKTGSANFTINKAELTFDISSESVKIGQDVVIHINVPTKTSGTFTINGETMNIPLSGVISYVLSDLEIGNYTYTATYNGNNYNTISKDTSFEVSEYPTPQWANKGENTQNNHKSPYETTTNGEIAFTIPFNQTLSGEMLIDSEGNLYLTTQEGVYCFNQTNQLWNFTSTDVVGNFSGICIGRDVIAAPKSGDTLYFINQSNGEKYGSSNIYQGSSIFAPVIDSDANIYIASEYQYSSQDYKLTIVPYKLWATGGNPTLITIGNTQPLCSPTLDENIIVIISDNRLRMVDAKTLETLSIKQGNFLPIRPVIGEGSVVYTVLSDSIVAYNINGVQVWKTKVIGGVGNTLAIDPEQAVYHINAKGLLYKYDIIDGAQSKVSNLKVTSDLLIGSDGTLYFGSNNIFYALDSEGNILWGSDLNAKIIGNPIMDNGGLIYVPTENGIVALTHVDLKDSDLKIQVDDIVEGQTTTVTITWNSHATGTITCSVNGEEITANVDDGKITKSIQGLGIGYYDVEASYSGDMRFKPTTVTKTFVVRFADDVANNIQFDGNKTFSFSLNNAEGNLTVKINDNVYSKVLSDGNASITINDLGPGDYDAMVIYSGDKIYNAANRTFSLSVPKFNVALNEQINTENIVSKITVSLPSDAGGNLTLSVGTKKYTEKVTNGNAVIIVDDLPAGNYTATLTYSGDNNYESVSKSVNIHPTKILVTLDDTNVFVESGSQPKVSVKLDANATGRFTLSVDSEEYSSDISEELIISGLEPGNYTGTLTYSGDFRFSKASKEIQFEVPKIVLQFNDSNLIISKLDDGIIVNVTLPSDARGDIVVSVNGTNYTSKLNGGVASLKVIGLAPENYQSIVTYAGSDKYEAVSKVFRFSIGMVEVSFNDTTLGVMSPSPQPVVNVKFDKAVTGNITVIVNNKEFSNELINGSASVELTGLNPGNYSANVAYSGDVKYGATEKTIQFEIPKISTTLENMIVKSNITVPTISAILPFDATGNITVVVSGKSYTKELINGNATVDLDGLAPGSYNVTVTYSGDGKYDSSAKIVNVIVPKVAVELNNDTLVIDGKNGSSSVGIDLPADATGTLTVTVCGKTFSANIVDGKATVNVDGLAPGSYNATVTYSGDSKYDSITKTLDVNVPKVVTELNNNTLVIDSQNVSSSVSINLPADATGTLSVTVDGKTYTENLVNGKATVNIPELADGEYNMTVTYSGDGKYEGITKTTLINVNNTVVDNSTNATEDNSTNTTVKADLVLIVSVDDINVGDSAVVNVRTSVKSGKLVVNVNNVDYELVISNGESSLTVPDLAVGNYNVVVRFAGDDRFNEETNSTAFNVLKVNVPITNETISIPESDSTQYSISLPSDATGTLTVTVDGKNYTETLTKGKATVNIPELSEGSHNITVTYSGDAKYSPIIKSSVVVKEHVPVIKLTGSNLNMLYTSGKYFKVRLTIDGQPFASQKVKITINGKTYTKTTDKNGYASLKISLPPKAYTVKATYGNLTITKKVTVKSIISAKNINAKKSSKSIKIKVTLKKVNKKYLKNKKVTLKFNKKTFKAKTNKKGVATFTIKNSVYKKLKTKKYTYQVIYAKDKVKKSIKFKK
ncbi:Ig-like domain repeat protein [Methanobrevibacter sp.]|uniref:Ig-like domain repeat protein n=1 Tax=Methanobrevibacter sp. TaxID=66852 RepID=UPI0039766515